MAENLLSSRVVAISLRDDLFDLPRHQSAYGNSLFRSDDLCLSNRGIVELDREISSAHARILRGARKARQSAQTERPERHGGASDTIIEQLYRIRRVVRKASPRRGSWELHDNRLALLANLKNAR